MECAVCDTRSSVSFCCDCSKLLCEQCGTVCARCEKMICPEHVHVTPHGRRLCTACMKERDTKRHHRRKRETPDEESSAFEETPGSDRAVPEEEESEERVLGQWEPTPPWKLSLIAACVAAAVGLAVLVLPWFAGVLQPWTSIIVGLVAVLAIVWAIVGLTGERYIDDRSKSFYGLGVAVVALILAGMAAAAHPGVSRDNAIPGNERRGMSASEVDQLRQDTLRKYE